MAKLLLLPKKLLAPCSGACVGGRRGWEAWCSDSHAGWQGGAGWGGARRGGRGEGRGGERAAEAGTCSGGRDLSRLDLCELFVPKRPRVVSHTVLAPRAWPALGQARVLLFDGHERREKVVALETRAEQVGDRPGADGGPASVSRAGWVKRGKQRPRGGGERKGLRAASPPTREPPSHTHAHAAERHAIASPGRRQHVSSTRALRDSSTLRELRLHALVASPCRARRAMCIGAVKPLRSRGPVLFISIGGAAPNSSGASSQVCLQNLQ